MRTQLRQYITWFEAENTLLNVKWRKWVYLQTSNNQFRATKKSLYHLFRHLFSE